MDNPKTQPRLRNRELNSGEHWLYRAAEKLIHTNVRAVGYLFIKTLRFYRRNHPVTPTSEPAQDPAIPAGPFVPAAGDAECALLSFVPRDYKSRLIDSLTGKYGYSHIAVDCGEVDLPTGKRVMIESTPFSPVHRSYQDRYGNRSFVRIPLAKSGLNCQDFSDCIRSKLGEKYDYAEALTWDQVDDPARQICSDLAAVCLPDTLVEKIISARENGQLSRGTISLHQRRKGKRGVFISPNGFAQFFNAPRGEKIHQPDVLAEPRIMEEQADQPIVLKKNILPGITFGILGVCALATFLIIMKRRSI